MATAAPRTYRLRHRSEGLVTFEVRHRQTDLWIRASTPLAAEAQAAVLNCRLKLESYLRRRPDFLDALEPLADDPLAPALVRRMLRAGLAAGVGPMAAVAGAIAEAVAVELGPLSEEILVENGGDCFLALSRPVTVGIHCGERSPFADHLVLNLAAERMPLAVCTSSGTLGHSLSLGRADAVTVTARDAALADAAATAIGNRVRSPADLDAAVRLAQQIPGLNGVLVVVHDRLSVWGDLELAPL